MPQSNPVLNISNKKAASLRLFISVHRASSGKLFGGRFVFGFGLTGFHALHFDTNILGFALQIRHMFADARARRFIAFLIKFAEVFFHVRNHFFEVFITLHCMSPAFGFSEKEVKTNIA
ncbi:MAG: hypothetical protein IAF08_16690 [Rhizobacter sp.]|nr:hypothetical protein [Chlorobiales bacterium]